MLQCQFNHTYICVYPLQEHTGRNRVSASIRSDMPLHKEDTGQIGKTGRKRIKQSVLAWSQALNYANSLNSDSKTQTMKAIAFLTLTLSSAQCHTHKEIKRYLLNHFLIILKRKYQLDRWLWKAEIQKNGNIHFHILVDVYIDKKEVQEIWNNVQNKLGYIDRFESRHGHRNPPSTEIKLIKDVNQALLYVRKYLSKENGEIEKFGRAWGCSDNLRQLSSFKLEMHKDLEEIFDHAVENGYSDVIVKDDYTVITDRSGYVHEMVIRKYNDLYRNWLNVNAMVLGFVEDTRIIENRFKDRNEVEKNDLLGRMIRKRQNDYYQSAFPF